MTNRRIESGKAVEAAKEQLREEVQEAIFDALSLYDDEYGLDAYSQEPDETDPDPDPIEPEPEPENINLILKFANNRNIYTVPYFEDGTLKKFGTLGLPDSNDVRRVTVKGQIEQDEENPVTKPIVKYQISWGVIE